MFLKFGYYTPELFIVPKCLEVGSMQEAVDLGLNPIDQDQENKEGEKTFFGQKMKIEVKPTRVKFYMSKQE